MPHNRSGLDDHHDEIQELYKNGLTHDEILNTINSRHGAQYSLTTLQRRLSAWGVNKGQGRRRTRVKNDELGLIQARVYGIMASHSDQQIFEILRSEGYEVGNVRTVRRIRKQMGVYRRHEQNDEQYDEQLRTIVRQEMENGNVAKYGRRKYLWQHLKQRGMVVARTRLIRIVQEVDPEGKYRCDRENNKGGKDLGSLKNMLPPNQDAQLPPTYGQTDLAGRSPLVVFAPFPEPSHGLPSEQPNIVIDPHLNQEATLQQLSQMAWNQHDQDALMH